MYSNTPSADGYEFQLLLLNESATNTSNNIRFTNFCQIAQNYLLIKQIYNM